MQTYREIKCLFTRTNILIRRFSKCSVTVKKKLFTAFCLCFYDVALWSSFTACCFNRFSSCYYKCMKAFLGTKKYSTVTSMLLELGLPSFNTVICNSKIKFKSRSANVINSIVELSLFEC